MSLAALLFAISLGIPLGFFAAKNYGGLLDHASLFISLIGISIPVLVLGIILKYIFSVRLGWLPGTGRIDVTITADHPTGFYVVDAILTRDWATLKDVLKHLGACIALGSIPLAIIARITRAAVLDVQNEDYVRTARAKGLSTLSSTVGTCCGTRRCHHDDHRAPGRPAAVGRGAHGNDLLLAGARALVAEAIFNRDYSVLQGGILFVAFVFVFVNLLVDVVYALINPRIRVS